jgi:Dienelactone hydrolase family
MKLREEAIEHREVDAELSGLLIWDSNELAHPGVLVVHGGGALDDHAKSRARQLAELGVLVLACDMYGRAVIGDRKRVPSSAASTGRPAPAFPTPLDCEAHDSFGLGPVERRGRSRRVVLRSLTPGV